jgi:type III pantothenate kinase
MLLVFDVGNTETTVGLFDGDVLHAHWRMGTDPSRTPDEFASTLLALLQLRGLDRGVVTGAAAGSVVPAMNDTLGGGVEILAGIRPLFVDARSALPITLDVLEPLTVGADRIINTLAAARLFQSDTIVVDLGTATTYDCITRDAVFLGGVIAPGIRTSAETLFRRTSKLPATELVPPSSAIGRRTEDCIRSGVVFGAAEALDGVVRRIKAEWPTGRVPLVVATGGLAPMIAPISSSVDRVEPHLTLIGLRMAYSLLSPVA